MADNDKPTTNPPTGAAPIVPAATASTQGVTKPGQGAVPQTPPNSSAAGLANLEKVAPKSEPADTSGTKTTLDQKTVGNQAPAVSTDSPIRVRRRALEAQLKEAQNDQSRRSQQARATTAAQLAELKDIEARQGHSNLNDLTPVGNLLVVDGAVHEQYPDDHLRWVNETIPGRAAYLKSIGYERVPDQTAGGDTVLWRVPRAHWASRTEGKNERTDRDLRKATSASKEEQTSRLQEFFDKQGVEVDVRRMILGG